MIATNSCASAGEACKPTDRARSRIQGEEPEQLHGNQSCTSCFPQGSFEHIPASPDPWMQAWTRITALPPQEEDSGFGQRTLLRRRPAYPATRESLPQHVPPLCAQRQGEGRSSVSHSVTSARWTSAFPAKCAQFKGAAPLYHLWCHFSSQVPLSWKWLASTMENKSLPVTDTHPGRVTVNRQRLYPQDSSPANQHRSSYLVWSWLEKSLHTPKDFP